MPAYYFRFGDSATLSDFSDGREFDTVEQAETEAVRELSFMASSRLPDGPHRQFVVTLFDAAGTALYLARLTFDSKKFV